MIDIEAFLTNYESLDNPYDFYDAVRGRDPVLWVEQLNRWLVTGYRQALFLLRHEHVSNDRRHSPDYQLPPGLDRPPGGIATMDPPAHTRLRALVATAFTPRLVHQLRQRVVELTDQLLDQARDRGEIDLMRELAYPLPATVLAELLGIPAQDWAQFCDWSTTFIDTFDPVSHRVRDPAGERAHAELERYLAGIVAERRGQPRADLISALIEAEEQGERLTSAELLEMCMLLTVAGLETTANLIGNGLSALLHHPDQMSRLRAEPGLAESAVEELLRYDPPIQVSGRIALADIELDGHTLRRGETIGVLLGAANRDPEAFAHPHRLDLGRRPNNHVGFGRGIHFCLGAPLARLEGAIALPALVTRFPHLRPAGAAKRRGNVHVRGFVSLPIALGP